MPSSKHHQKKPQQKNKTRTSHSHLSQKENLQPPWKGQTSSDTLLHKNESCDLFTEEQHQNTSKMVEFSQLNENNKAEFLEFLIKNNISFDPEGDNGSKNLTAKVTIKASTVKSGFGLNSTFDKPQARQTKNKSNRSPLKEMPSNTVGNSKNTPSANRAANRNLKEKSKLKGSNQIPRKSLNKSSKNNFQTPNKSGKKQNSQPLSSQTSINKAQKSSNSLTPKMFKNHYQDVKNVNTPIKNNQRNPHKVKGIKRSNQQQDVPQSRKQHFSDEDFYDERQKKDQFKSISKQEDRVKLAQKYNDFLSGSLNSEVSSHFPKQRPVRWSISQIEKLFDQFYDQDFVKNTHQIIGNGKKLHRCLQGTNDNFLMSSFQTWLIKKFNKNLKTVHYNLTNILYSVAFYIEKFEELSNPGASNDPYISNALKSCGKITSEDKSQIDEKQYYGMKIFENFLTQQFQFEEYLFFLFARNVLKKQFKKSFIYIRSQGQNQRSNFDTLSKQTSNKQQHGISSQKPANDSHQCCQISAKQIDRFLKHIIGNNSEILQEYHRTIFEQIDSQSVNVHEFMWILLKDYQLKRISAQEGETCRHHQQIQSSSSNVCPQQNFNKNQWIYPTLVTDRQTPTNRFNSGDSIAFAQGQNIDNYDSRETNSVDDTFQKIINIPGSTDGPNLFSKNHSQSSFLKQAISPYSSGDLHGFTHCREIKYHQNNNNKALANESSIEELTFGEEATEQVTVMTLSSPKSNNCCGGNLKMFDKKRQNLMTSTKSQKEKQHILKIVNSSPLTKEISEKLSQKTHELIELLLKKEEKTNDESLTSEVCLQERNENEKLSICADRLKEAVFWKAMSLLVTVIEMNKVKWLKELHIENPSQSDIQCVEGVQLLYRKLNPESSSREIVDFCKVLLTIRQIASQLQQVILCTV